MVCKMECLYSTAMWKIWEPQTGNAEYEMNALGIAEMRWPIDVDYRIIHTGTIKEMPEQVGVGVCKELGMWVKYSCM